MIYREIARLHIECIEDGFLPTLGETFLALIYEAIDVDPSSALIVESKNGKVIGFIAGGSGMRSIYYQMLKRWPLLFYSLVPSLLNPYKLKKIFEIILNNSGNCSKLSENNNELFSISVAQEFRGRGVAESLYKKLCLWFVSNGKNSFKIVVGQNLNRAHAFYLKMGANPVGKITIHEGEISTLYLHDLNNHKIS